MNAVALAQQAEAQNATTLIAQAVGQGFISETDANLLTEAHREEIRTMRTPQEVGTYVYLEFHETPDDRAARRVQERAALEQIRQDARNEVEARAINRANQIQPGQGGRRRRTRKSRL